MANTGLKYPVYAKATETASTITYSNGAALGSGITFKPNITHNDAVLYGNDVIKAIDKKVTGGSIALGITYLSDAIKVALFGYEEGNEIDPITHAKELKLADTSKPTEIGFGLYGATDDDDGNTWYRTIWFKKVQFSHPDDERETDRDKKQYKTHTLNGTIMKAADHYWLESGTFTDEDDAIAWLNTKAGISTSASADASGLALSNATLSPSLTASTYNYSAAATDNVTPTVTAAGATIKLYVDGVYNQTLTSGAAGTAVTMAAGNNKLFQIKIQESGKTAKTYNIMVQRAAG